MPNKQNDPFKLLPGITNRFLEVCFDIVVTNKLNKGEYKSVRALCKSIGMSEQSFFYLKEDSKGRAVTVSQIATLVHVHKANPIFIYTSEGEKYLS